MSEPQAHAGVEGDSKWLQKAMAGLEAAALVVRAERDRYWRALKRIESVTLTEEISTALVVEVHEIAEEALLDG